MITNIVYAKGGTISASYATQKLAEAFHAIRDPRRTRITGSRVLMIDADPRHELTSALLLDGPTKPTLKELLLRTVAEEERTPEMFIHHGSHSFGLVAAGDLAGVDPILASDKEPKAVMLKAITAITSVVDYDITLICCGEEPDLLLENAFYAGDVAHIYGVHYYPNKKRLDPVQGVWAVFFGSGNGRLVGLGVESFPLDADPECQKELWEYQALDAIEEVRYGKRYGEPSAGGRR